MPQPTSSLASLRSDLGAAFEEFSLEMNRRGFIAAQVLPVFDVQIAGGVFGRIPIEQLLQQRSVARASGGGYSRGNFTFTPDSYACQEYGTEEPVDDREKNIYATFFDLEMVATARAFEAVLNGAEQRAANLLFNSSTWTGSALTTAVSNEWDDASNATPIADIEAAGRKVWEGSGQWPNALICNRHVFRNLRNCDEIIDRVKAQGFMDVRAGMITTQQLAAVFDLERVIVAGGAKNASAEGQSVSVANIWSNEYAMVAKIASTNDIREPCVGRTFHYTGDGSEAQGTIESYRDESKRADMIRVRHDVHEKVLYVESAHLLSNITT